MQISVVIPSYNRKHTLQRALQSVIDQTSRVDEIILVDDGSTDASNEMVAREFPDVEIIVQSNLGVSAARNRGIAAARYDWIALLDSDDSWLQYKIEKIRQAQRQHPDYVLYHSDEIWIRRGRRVNAKHKHRKSGGWIFESCLPLCAISPSASVIRKSTLLDLGLFDPSLPACEDYDLWLRLCHQFPVYYIDQPLINKYGGHDDQLSQKHLAMDRFRIRALNRLLQNANLQPQDYLAAREMLLAKADILLKGATRHRNQSIIDEFEPLRNSWKQPSEARSIC